MNKADNEREIALEILMRMDSEGAYPHSLLRDVLDRYDYLLPQQKARIKQMTEGVTERRITLDHILNQYSSLPVPKMKPLIRSLLRLSAYQILYMDQIPDSAAVNEAVLLAEKRNFGSLKSFVNGILRRLATEKDNLPLPKEEESFLFLGDKEKEQEWTKKQRKSVSAEAASYLSVTYSMPLHLCGMWLKTYGYGKTKQILEAFLQVRPVTIRVDDRVEDVASLYEQMKQESDGRLEIKPHRLLPYAAELLHTDNLRYLYGYEEGAFTVQDVSSMLVTEIAELRKGDRVIDVCSAPGGKALHAAGRLHHLGGGEVVARDLSDAKCQRILENVSRMQLEDTITVQKWDATVFDPDLEEEADVLFCDLPCSGLGIIGRKTDIKYGVTPESMASLVELQQQILSTVWRYVKVGGTLIYSTCTIHAEENEKQLQWILENLPFEAVSIKELLPLELQQEKTTDQGYLQLLPGTYDTDGFFLARLRRLPEKEQK